MNLTEWFDKGLSINEYKQAQDKHEKTFFHILNTFSLNDDPIYDELKNKDLRVVAIVEEWCGHCMLNVPLLIKLCEKTNIPVRFLPRDEHLDLMNHYLTNDKKIIPIFIFINQDGNEVAKWGPIADEINNFVNKFREKLPNKDSDEYEAAFQNFIKQVGTAFETDESLWQASFNDIVNTLENDVL